MEKNRVNKQKSNAIDLTEVLRDYEDMWVVLTLDKSKVVASGISFDDISASLSLGTVMKVPKFIPTLDAEIASACRRYRNMDRELADEWRIAEGEIK